MSKCIDRTDRIALYLDRRIEKQKALSDLVTKILNAGLLDSGNRVAERDRVSILYYTSLAPPFLSLCTTSAESFIAIIKMAKDNDINVELFMSDRSPNVFGAQGSSIVGISGEILLAVSLKCPTGKMAELYARAYKVISEEEHNEQQISGGMGC